MTERPSNSAASSLLVVGRAVNGKEDPANRCCEVSLPCATMMRDKKSSQLHAQQRPQQDTRDASQAHTFGMVELT